jgi:hypothetical protein
MSKPRYDWWGYAKSMIRRYPTRTNESETAAVNAAIEYTKRMDTGEDRMTLVDMVFFRKTHTLAGAAMRIPCSERTARRYHSDFIRLVGENFHCSGLKEKDGPKKPFE